MLKSVSSRISFKVITGLAVIASLFRLMVVGFDQLQQARQDKQRDALERALNRLLTPTP